MKPLPVLVLCPWIALLAWSQTRTPFPIPPLSGVQQFPGLTDDQMNAILQNNSDYNTFSSQQQQTIQNAQSQIAVETAKDPLDPTALGTLYAGIESACRDLRSKASTSQQQNISLLTDAQKTKLNTLNDAIKLAQVIMQAQSGNLLGSTASPPSSFITASMPVTQFLSPVSFTGFSRCGFNVFYANIVGGILPPSPASPTQPATSVVNGVTAQETGPLNPFVGKKLELSIRQ
jgi:hypothetical protein